MPINKEIELFEKQQGDFLIPDPFNPDINPKVEVFTKDTIKAFLTAALKRNREEVLEEVKELLLSGRGRKTGVWHYEMNDHNEMEAGWGGEYLSIKEVNEALTQTHKVIDNLK